MLPPFIVPLIRRNALVPDALLPHPPDDYRAEEPLLQRLVDAGELRWETVFDCLERELAIRWKRVPDWLEDDSWPPDSVAVALAEEWGCHVGVVAGQRQVITDHPAKLGSFGDRCDWADADWEGFLALPSLLQTARSESGSTAGSAVVEEAPRSGFSPDESSDPLVQLVREVAAGVLTDIHLEPLDGEGGRVRLRRAGGLVTHSQWDNARWTRILASLMHRAHLAPDRVRYPQEGRMDLDSRAYRISVVPSINGPAAVLRQLPLAESAPSLQRLGMEEAMARRWLDLLGQRQGLLLVVGPTGCGKSTTVRCLLQLADPARRKVLTLEDPVEADVPGVQQVAVGESGALSFAGGIRASLRQNPDILFIGEIRDAETMAATLEAAMTGHLVISTVHARSFSAAVWRLLELGAEAGDLATQLSALLSQRLVRLAAHREGEYLLRQAVYCYRVVDVEWREAIRLRRIPPATSADDFAEVLARAQQSGSFHRADLDLLAQA